MERMEERIPLKAFFQKASSKIMVIVLFVLFLDTFGKIQAQNLSQNQGQTIRFSLWTLVDPVPGTEDATKSIENKYSYAVSQLKTLAPFIIEGMVYGWRFSYTPSDTLRGVQEYFEFIPLHNIALNDSMLSFNEPWYEEGRLNCWVEYTRSDEMIKNRKYWDSIMFPKIKGTGSGNVSEGIPGIKNAYSEAMKTAVREYARTIIKNKPKEINGVVLLTDVPRLYLTNGQYKADLDFFLDVDTIVPYSVF